MIYRLLLIFLLGILSVQVHSQALNEAAARAELEKRGYNAERFKEEMIKKGVNPDAIDANNPVDVARAKKAAEEVMVILDAEKKSQEKSEIKPSPNVNQVPPPIKTEDSRTIENKDKLTNKSKEIQKAVKEGATIEEAVSEKLQEAEKDKLPPAITYGQHIFRDKSLQLFRTAENAKPTKAYMLGPGDKVAVSIWGSSTVNFSTEIQKDGYIQAADLPRIYIAGLTLGQAEEQLFTFLRRYYYFTKENYELTVTTARTLNVNIVGEVFNNGTFNVSAVNTAFNALIAAGGPNDIGSVRKIQLLRAGNKPKTLDVYRYLQSPVSSQEFYLAENDYINVPVAQKLVTITGAVNRPFRYELVDDEKLMELIRFAGGLKANALKRNLQIKRIENDSIRIIDINFADLEKAEKNFALANGDSVLVFEINENLKNEVTITGAVENPGKYAMSNNEKIADLLRKAVLMENAITDIAYLKRYNDDFKTIRYEFINISNILNNPASLDNISLKKGDELIISSKASFTETYKISIEGAVKKATTIALDVEKNLKVSDAIFFAGGLSDDAIMDFAYIFRSKVKDAKTLEYISVNLKEALSNPTSASNITLEPKDRLFVYSKNNYTDESFIKVSGAVRNPSEFIYNSSLTLKDALILAGGLRREAALDRVDVYRLEFQDNKSSRVLVANLKVDQNYNLKSGDEQFRLQPFDQIFVRTAPEFELLRNVTVTGEVKYPGIYALIGDNTRLSHIIADAGGITVEAFLEGATLIRTKDSTGPIIIELDKALKSPKSFNDVILQEGDELFIPKLSNLVSITGATRVAELYPEKLIINNRIQVPFKAGQNARFYIDEYAGGLSREASKSDISVIDASGKVSKVKNILFFKMYPKVGPGAEVRVGYKPADKDNLKEKEKGDVKWGDILANSIAQATAILSLILLIQNVN